MKAWMATAAALALLAGLSTASAQNAPASNAKTDKTMEQSTTPKVKSSHQTRIHQSRIHQSMRMRHHARETTGFGGQAGTIGSGRNDPSIHQSRGDRDSRDFPKQH
jgi:hypothetical protein